MASCPAQSETDISSTQAVNDIFGPQPVCDDRGLSQVYTNFMQCVKRASPFCKLCVCSVYVVALLRAKKDIIILPDLECFISKLNFVNNIQNIERLSVH